MSDRHRFSLAGTIACFSISALLLLSWGLSPLSKAWQALDEAAFFALNGTLSHGGAWKTAWAFLNTRIFDLVMGGLMFVVLMHWLRAGGRSLLASRFAVMLTVALAFWAVRGGMNEFIEAINYRRSSPSATLQPVVRVFDHFSWIKAKDRSTDSFPGDHALVLFSFMAMILATGGPGSEAYIVLPLALGVLPRFMVGAHWISDVFVGSVSLMLLLVGLVWGTGLLVWSVKKLSPFMERWVVSRVPRWAVG